MSPSDDYEPFHPRLVAPTARGDSVWVVADYFGDERQPTLFLPCQDRTQLSNLTIATRAFRCAPWRWTRPTTPCGSSWSPPSITSHPMAPSCPPGPIRDTPTCVEWRPSARVAQHAELLVSLLEPRMAVDGVSAGSPQVRQSVRSLFDGVAVSGEQGWHTCVCSHWNQHCGAKYDGRSTYFIFDHDTYAPAQADDRGSARTA